MTTTLISLISILIGILGANITGYIFKKYSFGISGNTIIGVFGSIFFTKIISRFGIQPFAISVNSSFNLNLFITYLLFSIFGAIVFLIIAKKTVIKIKK